MKKTALAAALALTATLTSCSLDKMANVMGGGGQLPEGEIVSRTYDFNGVTGIDTSSGIYVYYTCLEETKPVKVVGPEDVLAELSVKLDRDGELKLSFKGNRRFSYRKNEQHAMVYVTAPGVRKYDASSGGLIEMTGPVTVSGTLEADVSSGGDIVFDGLRAGKVDFDASSGGMIKAKKVHADRLSAHASSGADITLAGSAIAAELSASSGGAVNASKLDVMRGKARASSGGSVKSAIKNAETKKSSGGSVSNKPRD